MGGGDGKRNFERGYASVTRGAQKLNPKKKVSYETAVASERSTFDHVTASARLQTRHVQPPLPAPLAPLARLASIPRPLPLTLKSPPVSPQVLLPTPRGSPTLTASSCQDNSIRDASPVEPSLGTTYCRSRIFLDPSFPFSLACRHRPKLSSRPLRFPSRVLGLLGTRLLLLPLVLSFSLRDRELASDLRITLSNSYVDY